MIKAAQTDPLKGNLYHAIATSMAKDNLYEISAYAGKRFHILDGGLRIERKMNLLAKKAGKTAAKLLEDDFEAARADKTHLGFSEECNTVIKIGDTFIKAFVRRAADDPEGYGIYFTTETSLRKLMGNLKRVFSS